MKTTKLNDFQKYIKPKKEVKTNNKVWVYTRVSSKEQFNLNGSLDTQKQKSIEYAQEKNLDIVKYFGGTYESAKGDFTRKEFKKLIDEIRRTKNKPFAILIYKINRFSRSGGEAQGLVHELVYKHGVHLIETLSEKNTLTERGCLEILDLLKNAKEDNLDRLEITIPGMKSALRKGKKLGSTPLGYDHYGPKVKNFNFIRPVQQIVLNPEGQILRQAWIMKKTGEPDNIIIKKSATLGLIISKQTLSSIWRNPFYCGILINSMIDEPVMGNWEPIVSIDDFKYINDVLEGKGKAGYKQVKYDESRPLQSYLYCSICGGKMTGYKSSQKNIHYYKCQTKGCECKDLYASTGKKTITKGLNLLFEELLEKITLKGELIPHFKKQIKSILEMSEKHKLEQRKNIKSEITRLDQTLNSLLDKFLSNQIDNNR
jgi:DNA invertase Pin-like site-specific DNA recombinase